ncbi:unnamed protein product [Blepharisma stoltei]|uniref:RING-CH-type domain-containing protein n=1 Tax=Blepharisma stoltei TaxID=1481888 RepID=A0AAU9K1U6_9CILI|nr:unnamed protein product [Blepharisma stoltei]
MKSGQLIIMKTMTWGRDSHNLFDYESRNCFKKQLQTSSSCQIARAETDVNLLSLPAESRRLGPNSNILATVSQENGNFYINSEDEPLWQIVRSLKTQDGPGHVLKKDDVIKLGRACYKIKELNFGQDDSSSEQTQESEEESMNEVPEEHESGVCRICFCESEPENPLIAPCNCTGSVKHIHLQCLQKWLSYHMSTKQSDNSAVYHWKTIECELCKGTFPFSLGIKGKDHNLFQVEKSGMPYIVLEASGQGKGNAKGAHVITFSNNSTVKLGRGHESDVRISDISVSRCHAIIRFENNQFILEDNNSKFGTLLQVAKPIGMTLNSTIALQCGRTVLALSLKAVNSNLGSLSPYDTSIDEAENYVPYKRSL